MKPKPPPGGWPWEQPGFKFWTPGFPPGYVPTLERETPPKPAVPIGRPRGRPVRSPKEVPTWL